MNLEYLLSQLRYPSEIEQALRQKIHKDRKKIEQFAETAYQGENFNFPLCRRMPLTRLAVVTCLLPEKYEAYKEKNIPDAIIWDTFQDVSLRAKQYYDKNGKVGLTKEDVIWFRHIMNVDIFKVGVLQYQPFEMLYLDEDTIGSPYMTFLEEQKQTMPSGVPVLNCHIPCGTDLSREAVGKSLAAAKIFFEECYPTAYYKAFLCYSWLLYPPMVERLSESSNIRQFAERFTIIGFCEDPEQAVENLDRSTSLGKLAKKHRGILGFACGIIPLS